VLSPARDSATQVEEDEGEPSALAASDPTELPGRGVVGGSLYLSQLASLRRKELTAADIIRNQQAKFEQSGAQVRLKSVLGGRGKRYVSLEFVPPENLCACARVVFSVEFTD
jgi:hypothetical protein